MNIKIVDFGLSKIAAKELERAAVRCAPSASGRRCRAPGRSLEWRGGAGGDVLSKGPVRCRESNLSITLESRLIITPATLPPFAGRRFC